jgi:hypothetical protein
LSILKFIWNLWMKFVIWFGTVQMIFIVTIVYWLILPFTGVIAALISDPMGRRLRNKSTWIPREKLDDPLAELKRQG